MLLRIASTGIFYVNLFILLILFLSIAHHMKGTGITKMYLNALHVITIYTLQHV